MNYDGIEEKISNRSKPHRVLGIDPGYDRVGVAVIEKRKNESGRMKEYLIFSQCITTDRKNDLTTRIFTVGQELEKIIELFAPTHMAIENVYFQKNQKTIIGVSEAKGVCKYIGMRNELSIHEFTPLQIKVAITGQGNAEKSQVAWMIPRLITLDMDDMAQRSGGTSSGLDDELDAIAVALTALAHGV